MDWIAWRARARRFEEREEAGPVDVDGGEGEGELMSSADWAGDSGSGSSGIVSLGAREWASDAASDCESEPSPEPELSGGPAKAGNCEARISSCCLTSEELRSDAPPSAAASTRIRRLLLRGTLRSRGISRSSRGGARSIAAKSDCSHRTKVSILWQERRNWSASARTRITKRFLSGD